MAPSRKMAVRGRKETESMPESETSSRVLLRLEEGYRFTTSFEGTDAGIVTDEPPPLGQGQGPNPAALLATAVGSCLASSLLFCTRKARLEPTGLEVEVEVVTGRNPAGRMRIKRMEARLAPRVQSADLERWSRCLDLFESFCTVTESVRSGIAVDVTVEPRPEAARPDAGPATQVEAAA
jgi:organic hydroperoxide reductase OsmC/OhrA